MDYKYKYNYASPDWYKLLKEFAKKNKQFATDAERILWDQIRSGQLGIKFNRQYIIGDYIVDFVCLERKFVIEVDGGYHSENEQIQKDEHRTERLERMGFTVVRFTNEEILLNTKNVIDNIKTMCSDKEININPSPLGEKVGGLRVGILGAAGYTGGELIRVLLSHPDAEIVFANSESNAGNLVSDVHEGLVGDTDLRFTDAMPFDEVDVVFFCFGHGKSEAFLKEHEIPASVKIIDLAQDFRIKGDHDYVYGLPETHRDIIRSAQHLANPGCFATCIQLALLPALKGGLIEGDIHVSGVTGSTGAGQKPGATTHFSWRNDNISLYKTFKHQHLLEINQTVQELAPGYSGRVLFIPQRGCFARGIYVTAVAKCDAPLEQVHQVYAEYYKDAVFTHFVTSSPDMKQVVNTNKALVYVEKFEDQLLMVSTIDNLLKGAVGQAVENMNLMFGLDERAGLNLKASAF